MTTITLPERCDRAAAKAMLPEFVAALGNERLDVDGSRVALAGHAMLQVLASARNSFTQLSIRPSQTLLEAARLAGLHSHLFEEGEA